MKFTIIMPTYGRSALMETAVKSVFAQTYDDWELLIIDDGSGELEVMRKRAFVDKLADNRVRLVELQLNHGHAHARNVGLSAATGDWVKYLDDDDELYPNCLEVLNEKILTEDPLVITAKYHSISSAGTRVIGDDFRVIDVFKSCKLDTCCFAHALSCVDVAGGWDERLLRFADGEIIARYTMEFNDRYTHVDEVLSTFEVRDNLERVSTMYGNFPYMNMTYDKHMLRGVYGALAVFVDSAEALDELINFHNFTSSDFMSMDVFASRNVNHVDHVLNEKPALRYLLTNYTHVTTYSAGSTVIDDGLQLVRFGKPSLIVKDDVFSSVKPLEFIRVANRFGKYCGN